MKVTLVLAASLDGKITRDLESNVQAWTSPEDQAYFKKLISQTRLIIMGRRTYSAAKSIAQKDKLRVIYTRSPEDYQLSSVEGQLEFTNEAPYKLLDRLAKRGFGEALLIGGSEVATDFLQAGLVNEIWLTLEPVLFGKGTSMVKQEVINQSLQLLSIERLNERGTLLLKYAVK